MSAMTREELVALPLKLVTHFTSQFESVRTVSNEEHGITMVTVTRRIGKQWGEGRKAFYLDGLHKPIATTDALLAAVNARAESKDA